MTAESYGRINPDDHSTYSKQHLTTRKDNYG